MKFIKMFGSSIVIGLIAILIGIAAYLAGGMKENAIEEAAEAVADVEFGLPPGTINIEKELGKK